jgi:cell division septation protein DedD
MRDSHRLKEKYDLSLDDRQIVTLTIASLVVLGGVFMLGVVVGKKLSGAQPDQPSADLLGQLDQRTAALNSLKEQDAAALTFQDELTKKAPGPVVLPPAKAPPEKVAAAETPKVETPKVEVSAAPPLPESPKAEAIATRTNDGGGLKEAFGKAQRPPAEAVADGAWTVQLAAYQERAEADRFAAGLRDKGYAPYIVEVAIPNKGQWFRVRMGRFPNRDAASRYMDDFKRETSINAMVTPAH